MTPDKRWRIATAILFLFGVFTCLKALGDAGLAWPPAEVWEALTNPGRFKLSGGIVLILTALIVAVARKERS